MNEKPKKRKYKGLYCNAINNGFNQFMQDGNLLSLLQSISSVADDSIRYEWQWHVFDRELRDAFNKVEDKMIILFKDNGKDD
jgi:hypothetical protein